MKENAEHVNMWIQAMTDQIKKEYNKASRLQWEPGQLFPTFFDLCATFRDGSTRQTVKEDLELMCRVLKQQIDTTVGEGVVYLGMLRMKVKERVVYRAISSPYRMSWNLKVKFRMSPGSRVPRC